MLSQQNPCRCALIGNPVPRHHVGNPPKPERALTILKKACSIRTMQMLLSADSETEARFPLNCLGQHKPLLEVEPADNGGPTYSHTVTSLTIFAVS